MWNKDIDCVVEISIQFNGQATEVPPETTIAQLLEIAGIRSQLVAVEVNLEIVPREQFQSYTVAAGDVVEAVTLVGGG